MAQCTLCEKNTESLEHEIEQMVIEMIKKSNPDWVAQDGACNKCIEYYRNLDGMIEVV